jgi:hypothetical protein
MPIGYLPRNTIFFVFQCLQLLILRNLPCTDETIAYIRPVMTGFVFSVTSLIATRHVNSSIHAFLMKRSLNMQNSAVKAVHWLAVVVSVGGFVIYSWLMVVLSAYTTGSTVGRNPVVGRTSANCMERISNWMSMDVSVVSAPTPLNGRRMTAVRAVIAFFETAAALTCILVHTARDSRRQDVHTTIKRQQTTGCSYHN